MKQAILDFWFEGARTIFRPRWFEADAEYDAAIRTRFGTLLEPAGAGAFDAWPATPAGALALVILLDQFPRNLRRGSAAAFALDPKARAIARAAVLRDRLDLALTPTERGFLYLPFEHAEAMPEQDLSVAVFEGLRDDPVAAAPGGSIDYAWRHRAVIARFGRFPHRNAALGRADTPAEAAYLALPGSGF